MNDYTIGSVANDHVLTEQGWVPTATLTAQSVEAEVERRMTNAKTTAWLLWFFLGGFNAHLAYIYPKNRALIIGGSIAAFFLTFGISGFLWLFSWLFLLDGKFPALREHTRIEVEREIVTRKALYA